ncbi:pyridoxal phosphate-dependent aminotransferase [Amycolatopsis sp. A1MSW2902]|uniref:MalY/PatB family protein n=1 Tax=Amycolatopsis sp. A1MSW2902 TaxID=687413 RepID=UPI00307D1C90
MSEADDFSSIVDRSRSGSAKWLSMFEGKADVPKGIVPFSVADMDFACVSEIAGGLRRYLEDAVLGYTLPTEEYWDSVVGWFSRRHSWEVSKDHICLSPGVVRAVFTAVRAYARPGDGIIVQTPGYYSFYRAVELSERVLVRNPLAERGGRWRIDFDDLAAKARDPQNKVLLFCSPHNSTGRAWERWELERVAQIAVDNGLIVVSDEIHFDLVMPGHQHTVFSTLGPEAADRSVVCTAPSKTFNLAGMATSNIVIENEQLRAAYTVAQEKSGFFSLNVLGYEACRLAYTQGESWLEGLIDLVSANHGLVAKKLRERIPEVRVFDLKGTYLQWMDFRSLGLGAAELERINVEEALVFFDEGTLFGPEGEGYERMNLASPIGVVEAAVERLADAYRGVRNL